MLAVDLVGQRDQRAFFARDERQPVSLPRQFMRQRRADPAGGAQNQRASSRSLRHPPSNPFMTYTASRSSIVQRWQ